MRINKVAVMVAAIVLICCQASAQHRTRNVAKPHCSPAQEEIDAAFEAMGGRSRLEGLASLRLGLRTISYRVDDSERATGPFWLNVSTADEWRDERNGRYRSESEDASAQWTISSTRIDQGRGALAVGQEWLGKKNWSATASFGDRMAFAPERLLATAAAASDLTRAPDQDIEGKPQTVLRFTWKGFPVALFLDRQLHLPTRLEMTRGSPVERISAMLGDIRWRTDFLFYKPTANGLVYPHQWNLFRDGQPYQTTVVTAFDANAPMRADFEVPLDAKLDLEKVATQSYADLPVGGSEAVDPIAPIAPDVWLIRGNWNVAVVRQSDGLVLFEAPQSSGYSEAVLSLLSKRFPGVPVKALVSSTDSLWHYAGLRAYVARGIPIYALDMNLPRLRAFAARSRTFAPDRLARHPRAPILRAVSGRTAIGDGDARIDLYPVRGHGDERMVMAFLPATGLLYGSSNDIAASTEQPTFNDFELVARAKELGLFVKDYFAIHTDPVSWARFQAIVHDRPVLSGRAG